MKKIRNLILIVWMSAVVAQLGAAQITFDTLKSKFNLPATAQDVMQYYINTKMTSTGGFYGELYEYFNQSNLSPEMKKNVLRAMAYLAGSRNEAELQNKVSEIQDELDKIEQSNMMVVE